MVPQPLCQWGEVTGHPGLITCLTQSSNNPVILMVKPDHILIQEIRVLPAKSKMTDLVALRHSWSPNHEAKTTLILLCEDGSLRIYNANPQTTDFWLSPQMQVLSAISSLRPSRKKKTPKLGRPSGSVVFPVDFFEHCSVMNDIEYGGNDLLQVYNVQQLKNRLNSQGMYIASTKPGGFQLEVTNNDSTLVICGLRVAVGAVDTQRVPAYLEIFGRSVSIAATRSRWFDTPLTREESLQADKRIVISFGPSADPSNIAMVDFVKIYGKTKEDFGWPEEPEDFSTTVSGTGASGSTGSGSESTATGGTASTPLPLTAVDRLVSAALETLDGCFVATPAEKIVARAGALDLATKLLNLPLPPTVQHHTRTLLASLHQSRMAYHNHKDGAQLASVVDSLNNLRRVTEPQQLDCEAYHRLVVTARNVAAARPHNLVKYTEKVSADMTLVQSEDDNKKPEATSSSPSQKTDGDASLSKKSDGDSTLSKASDTTSDSEGTLEGGDSNGNDITSDETHFLAQLMSVFWALHSAKPTNLFLTPMCQPGLTHVEATVQAVVEIIHAYTVCSLSAVPLAVRLYTELLLCSDTSVSFGAKQALIRVLRPRHKRRKVFIPSPPRCSTPGVGVDDTEKPTVTPQETGGAALVEPPFEGA
ncbi:hypothetical protein OTU49_011871, partial [Cherax quadricarinatus]